MLQDSAEQRHETALSLKESQLCELETQLEMLRQQAQSQDAQTSSELMAACESDKIAASRAMTQNKQLKEQLEELETAIVQLVRDNFIFNESF